MVEIRVALPDATGVRGLMRSLAGLFERSSISFGDRAYTVVGTAKVERASRGK
jgi:hypothetical protein